MSFEPLRRIWAALRRFRLPAVLAPLAVIATAGILAGVFLRSMLDHNGKRYGAPVDDAYIYFNYAKQLAQGHFFEYNAGDGISTGATSWLWTSVLAVGYRIGFRGDNIVLWAFSLGTAFLIAYGLLLLRLARRIFAHRLLGALFAILVLLDGRVLWGFFSGMEVGLYTLSLAATLETAMLYRAKRSGKRLAAVLASVTTLTLVRPEGQVLGVAAMTAIFLQWILSRPRNGVTGFQRLRADRRAWLIAIVPLALVALVYLTLLVKLGGVTQNGMRTKSHLFAPDQTAGPVIEASTKFFKDMLLTHFPWHFPDTGKALLDLFVYTGLLVGAAREVWLRRPGILLLAATWFVGGLLLQSIVLNAAYHHGRYVMNYTFLYWLCFAAGLWRWLRWHRIPVAVKRLAAGGALVLVASMMLGTVPIFRNHFGNDIRTIGLQHVAMAEHMKKVLPAGASVGMNDVGAGAYYSDRYIVDVYGLTTNELAPRKWEGQACILEELKHGLKHRPDYMSIYPTWYRAMTDLGFFKLMTKYHVDPPHINGGDDMNLYSVDWSSTLDEAAPHGAKAELERAGVKIVDHMDVAYRKEEIAHKLEFWRNGRASQWGSDLMKYQPYVGMDKPSLVEGGRTVREREAWTASGLVPGKELWIVRRTQGPGEACRVSVDGKPAGTWEPGTDTANRFRDEIFKIAGNLVTGKTARLTFVVDGDKAKKTPRRGNGYDAFYYWIAQ